MKGNIYHTAKKYYCINLFFLFQFGAIAQSTEPSPLFLKGDVLEVRLEFPFREVKKSRSDTIYFASQLHYKSGLQEWDSIEVRIRGRGNFRRDNCFFLPIKMKIKKKDNAGTLFEGNQNLKLVMPCMKDRNSNDLVIKEYLCYKLYELISPYTFSTRLINLNLTDSRKRNSTSYNIKGFIIEDDKQVARRANGEMLEGFQRNALFMQDSLAALHDVFQYMIGNTDWSSDKQHNVKMMLLPSKAKVPIPFDFDMSGLVNAPYAVVNELIPIENVRERHFRGICRNKELAEYVRIKYLKLEPAFWETFHSLEDQLDSKEAIVVEDYLKDFFSLVADKKRFEEIILRKCRKLE